MKNQFEPCWTAIRSATAILVATIALFGGAARAASDTPPATAGTPAGTPAADQAWEALRKAMTPPMPPPEWRTNRPSEEQIEAFKEKQKAGINVAIDKAADFYKRFPEDARAKKAREQESNLLQIAARMGDTNRVAQLAASEAERAKDPNLSEDERFEIRAKAIQREASAKGNREAAVAAYEEGVRQLMKEFPKRSEPFEMLLSVASSSDPDKARKLAKEIADNPAAGEAKAQAQKLLAKYDAVGKPLDLKFKAVDGREVDVAALKGKVVLVDFWATWCGPCVAELPNVKAAYQKLHPKGLEIVGISLDSDKDKLEKFVAEKEMSWPQYFDGKGWESDIGQKFGINSIPAMWLVDKKGVLRDLDGRDGLEAKVEKFLAE